MPAYNDGQRHFGENYVQEILEKASQLPSDIRWHFIGHLQSNKARDIVKRVPNLWMVESLDSEKCANNLNKACMEFRPDNRLKVLVQVNTSLEDAKSGLEEDEVGSLVEHITMNCAGLEFVGLMTIGKLGDPNPRPYFQKLRELRNSLPGIATAELSMGMSSDFVEAIEMGSTNVRVGSTIFGSRPAKPSSPKGKAQPADATKDELDRVTGAAAALDLKAASE